MMFKNKQQYPVVLAGQNGYPWEAAVGQRRQGLGGRAMALLGVLALLCSLEWVELQGMFILRKYIELFTSTQYIEYVEGAVAAWE